MENAQNRTEESPFARTELMLGAEAMARLARSRVAVFGIGGVGGYVAEALARSGIFHLDLIDKDEVSLTVREKGKKDVCQQFLTPVGWGRWT